MSIMFCGYFNADLWKIFDEPGYFYRQICAKGKHRMSDSSSSSQARSGTSTDMFAVMVLLNFYLHVLIYY
jgi:hypothetical protein